MTAVTGGSVAWYLARGTGVATLILLTFTMVLGIANTVRWSPPRWPRFAIEYVHRNVTLLVLVFLGLHVATVVLDGFAPIGWKDTIVPFMSPYRPLWLGLGVLAVDLLLAVAITSWLRHRIGFATWRTLHWLAYATWPLAVAHGVATGTDTMQRWTLLVNLVCVAAVVVALWWRLAVGWTQPARTRLVALVATFVLPVIGVVWLRAGPLGSHWARRAGTPANLIHAGTGASGGTTSPSAPAQPSDEGGR